jgi:RNA exonuclease 4
LGALRVVRNGRIINLFDAEEEDKERKQREVRSGPPIPLNDDFSITDCLALDCEMVGVGLGGVKSVLGQVSVINEHLNVVYTSYCRPTETVTDYRTQWSGLTEVHLRDAPSFEEVQNKVVELFGSGGTDGRRKIIMTGHGLENDLEVLRMTYPKELLRDTATWKPILRPPHFKKPQKLRKLVKIHCNFSIQRTTTTNETNGETTSKSVLGHDPSEDARGSMVLYLKFKSRWEHDIATRGVLRANIASSRFR